MIFAAAPAGLGGDALAVFLHQEMPRLEWFSDYMMQAAPFEDEVNDSPSFEVIEEEEPHFDKKVLTTTETDSGWDI